MSCSEVYKRQWHSTLIFKYYDAHFLETFGSNIQALNQEPAQELYSRAAPSVEARHLINGHDRKKFYRKADNKKLLEIRFSNEKLKKNNIPKKSIA